MLDSFLGFFTRKSRRRPTAPLVFSEPEPAQLFAQVQGRSALERLRHANEQGWRAHGQAKRLRPRVQDYLALTGGEKLDVRRRAQAFNLHHSRWFWKLATRRQFEVLEVLEQARALRDDVRAIEAGMSYAQVMATRLPG